jgi:hypothetical protein
VRVGKQETGFKRRAMGVELISSESPSSLGSFCAWGVAAGFQRFDPGSKESIGQLDP